MVGEPKKLVGGASLLPTVLVAYVLMACNYYYHPNNAD